MDTSLAYGAVMPTAPRSSLTASRFMAENAPVQDLGLNVGRLQRW